MVRFEFQHLREMTGIRDNIGDPQVVEKTVKAYAEQGMAFTIIHDDKVIAICGAVLQWPGVAEAWFLTTHHVDNCKFYFYREVRKLLEYVRKNMGLHRIQCAVESDYFKSMKWLKSMNFKSEGLMAAYGPDKKDHYRYSLIWLS